MTVLSARLTFCISHANSLKDKRQVSRSIIDKARHKFNASIAEVDTQNMHQILTIGVAVVSGDAAHAKQMIEELIRFMEEHADAELTGIDREQTPLFNHTGWAEI